MPTAQENKGVKSTGFSPLDYGSLKNALRVAALIEKSRRRGMNTTIRLRATAVADAIEDLMASIKPLVR